MPAAEGEGETSWPSGGPGRGRAQSRGASCWSPQGLRRPHFPDKKAVIFTSGPNVKEGGAGCSPAPWTGTAGDWTGPRTALHTLQRPRHPAAGMGALRWASVHRTSPGGVGVHTPASKLNGRPSVYFYEPQLPINPSQNQSSLMEDINGNSII